MVPVLLLLGLCLTLTLLAGPAMAYMQATAQYLHLPSGYTGGVFGVSGGEAVR
jgi:multicomponent K+:H+ antiporter subunit D